MEDDVARFVIDGRDYEVPNVDTLTMGEAIVVYDYSGLGLHELGDNANNPGLIASFMHIAYQRANPDQTKTDIRKLIEATSLVEAFEKLAGDDDDSPTVRKTGPSESSPPSSSSSDASSGTGSPNGSDEQADAQPNTGATKSATLHI